MLMSDFVYNTWALIQNNTDATVAQYHYEEEEDRSMGERPSLILMPYLVAQVLSSLITPSESPAARAFIHKCTYKDDVTTYRPYRNNVELLETMLEIQESTPAIFFLVSNETGSEIPLDIIKPLVQLTRSSKSIVKLMIANSSFCTKETCNDPQKVVMDISQCLSSNIDETSELWTDFLKNLRLTWSEK